MTIEHVPAPAEAVEPAPAETPAPAAPDSAAPETPDPARPHPLQPGGVRFEEVYGKWKTAEGRLAELERQLEEARTAKAEPKPAAAPVLTVEQIQAALDGGQITAAQAAYYFAVQAKAEAKAEAVAEFQGLQRQQAVTAEVATYTDTVPALRDPTSDTYRRVSAAAAEIAAEMNRPVRDPVVLRRAMRETLGPVEQVGARTRVAEQDRQRTDPGGVLVPGSGGGAAGPKAEPLKGVPKAFVDFWRAKGLSDAQILEDAKHLSPSEVERLKAR